MENDKRKVRFRFPKRELRQALHSLNRNVLERKRRLESLQVIKRLVPGDRIAPRVRILSAFCWQPEGFLALRRVRFKSSGHDFDFHRPLHKSLHLLIAIGFWRAPQF